MPKKTFKKVKPQKHPLVGKNIDFLQKHLITGNYTIVLLSSKNCLHCLGAHNEVKNFLDKYKFNFISLIYEPNSEEVYTRKKYLDEDNKMPYIEQSFSTEIKDKHDLSIFPTFIFLGEDGAVIEFTATLKRVEYLLESSNEFKRNIS
ncbi:hypothetical protein [Bacillus toyonensis]|uniref:hypothetical protein n=1 Tax=Bacillus toyonensis TaxID=155322 RepID=UPI002175C9AD|nr:hypothetical protein [Bacillus toyonensis]